jgi:hypothetical protein
MPDLRTEDDRPDVRNRMPDDPAEQGERGTQDEPRERRRPEDEDGDDLVVSQR